MWVPSGDQIGYLALAERRLNRARRSLAAGRDHKNVAQCAWNAACYDSRRDPGPVRDPESIGREPRRSSLRRCYKQARLTRQGPNDVDAGLELRIDHLRPVRGEGWLGLVRAIGRAPHRIAASDRLHPDVKIVRASTIGRVCDEGSSLRKRGVGVQAQCRCQPDGRCIGGCIGLPRKPA